MLTPYFENDLGSLYCGNCIDILPELIAAGVRVDAVVADPPYGMGFVSNHRAVKYKGITGDDGLEWLWKYVDLLYVIMVDDAHVYNFCSWHKVDVFKTEFQRLFNLKNIIVWNKNNTGMGDLVRQYAPKHEFIIYGAKGDGRALNGNRVPDVVTFEKTGNDYHPTQKPVPLLELFVDKSTDQGQIVLDPFAGSGSTLIAAQAMGRRWIGIEISPDYCKVAAKRLDRTIDQILGQVQMKLSFE